MSPKAIFDKKNILVVGGAGFIGSHLCEELLAENKVICLDNFITGDEDNVSHLLQNPNFKLMRHDLTLALDLEKRPDLKSFRLEFQGLQAVYFLASPTSPKAYGAKPVETLLANSLALKNALDLAVKYRAQFLYASSPVVYGDVADKKSIKEDSIGPLNHLGPRACYGEAKRFGETLVENYRQQFDLDTKIARIANCYGPRLGLNDGRMIPEMIKAALTGKIVEIYGDKKSSGAYFYVTDLIKALVKLMESDERAPINISSDWKMTFTEVAEKIIELTDSKAKIKYLAPTALMAAQSILDIGRAKEVLGWFPIILLEEGLKETIDYLSAQRGVLEPEK